MHHWNPGGAGCGIFLWCDFDAHYHEDNDHCNQHGNFTRSFYFYRGGVVCTFDSVDQLLLTEIYAASEKPIPGVSGQSLAQGIRQVSTTPVEYYQTLNDLAAALPNVLREGDVLLTLGAGSITRLGPAWLEGQDHA